MRAAVGLATILVLLASSSMVLAGETTWSTSASDHVKDKGQQFSFDCPSGGSASSVWGSDTYTTDSSICTAAVHAGLITMAAGGKVTISITDGQENYTGTNRNGVTTSAWGAYETSFTFGGSSAIAATWTTAPNSEALEVGKSFTFSCPAGGEATASVWGSGPYTTDSSVCAAAVHSGAITAKSGGTVTIAIVKGKDAYEGTVTNGVTTNSWGAYDPAFTIQK